MRKLWKRGFSVLTVLLAMVLAFTACTRKPKEETGGEETDGGQEYTLPLEDGKNQLTIYYKRSAGGYDDCDVWLWYGEVAGRGYLFHTCEYGAKMVVNIPEDVTEVGYLIRTGCSDPGGESWGTASKDGSGNDRSLKITGRETVIYTQSGDDSAYTSEDGGKTLTKIKLITLADMQDDTHIKYVLSSAQTIALSDVHLTDSDNKAVAVKAVETNPSNGIIETESPLDITKSYQLSLADLAAVSVVPNTYFSSTSFNDAYYYDGKLGVEIEGGKTTFRLWAPTASSVVLNLFAKGNGGSAESTQALTRGEKGVWTYEADSNLNGKYYTYTVTTSVGAQEAVDPYAVSAGLNGDRGMILDLGTTDPTSWDSDNYVTTTQNYTDAEIWEVQIRDFSNKLTSSQYKGKYLAFTERGLTNSAGQSVGVDYLVELGITHVHLMPAFDYASVDESKTTGYNWGYDPKNYNVPEGSYSTDATDGAKRVNEFKQMVQSLHNAGIGVIMDMVYNHTYDLNSNLNKIVPYYYYRYSSNGAASNGSGCGNETASDRSMFRRYMVDSVSYWQSEYHVDGFRFDLMALHDLTTMQEIEKSVHKENANAILYGEGWMGGTSALATAQQCTLYNLKNLNSNVNSTSGNHTNGIAMFNDVIRDAIKGSVFNAQDTGFATGAKQSSASGILFGVNGGVNNTAFGANNSSWSAYNPTNVVNYASAHDNHTLWDRICYVYGEEAATLDARMKRNALSAAIVHTSLGIPFMMAGEEMLRSKKNKDGTYNENSYNASDDVNNIQWDLLTEGSSQSAMMNYYKGLIAMRKALPTLRLATSSGVCTLVKSENGVIAFTMTNAETGETLYIVYNASESETSVTLPTGSWNVYAEGMTASGTAIREGVTGTLSVGAISCTVLKKA